MLRLVYSRRPMKRRFGKLALSIGLAAALCTSPAAAEDTTLLLVTTTSVRDSGLLDALLPAFRERAGVRVQVVAVGSGAALRMGSEGNADVLLTHAPAQVGSMGKLSYGRSQMENSCER